MKFLKWFGKPRSAASSLYARAVGAARNPVFFSAFGVPDTPEGRFDMIAIHVHLLLRRLRRDGDSAAELAQSLFDLMFADMDQNLREMGVGDLSGGKRVKAMAAAFYGRIAAYDPGLDGDRTALDDALRRNLYRHATPTTHQSAAVGAYMLASDQRLAAQPLARLAAGQAEFAPVAVAEEQP